MDLMSEAALQTTGPPPIVSVALGMALVFCIAVLVWLQRKKNLAVRGAWENVARRLGGKLVWCTESPDGHSSITGRLEAMVVLVGTDSFVRGSPFTRIRVGPLRPSTSPLVLAGGDLRPEAGERLRLGGSRAESEDPDGQFSAWLERVRTDDGDFDRQFPVWMVDPGWAGRRLTVDARARIRELAAAAPHIFVNESFVEVRREGVAGDEEEILDLVERARRVADALLV